MRKNIIIIMVIIQTFTISPKSFSEVTIDWGYIQFINEKATILLFERFKEINLTVIGDEDYYENYGLNKEDEEKKGKVVSLTKLLASEMGMSGPSCDIKNLTLKIS